MTKCLSCGAYGNSDHISTCATRTGRRIIVPVLRAIDYQLQRKAARPGADHQP